MASKVVPRLIAVIGRQRSGTTVLRQFIGSAEGSFDLGEVFHSNTARTLSFWGFLHGIGAANPTYRFPLHWKDAWDSFIHRQSTDLAADVLAFDVKVEYFPLVLRTDGDTTDFFFNSADIDYIWLKRNNTAAQAISRHVAAATGIWSDTDPDADPDRLARRYAIWGGQPTSSRNTGDISINPDDLIHEICTVQRQDVAIDRILGHKFALRLTYEEMFDAAGRFRSGVVDSVATLTGLAPDNFDRRPILRQQRQHGILDGIANAGDIVTKFAGTGYEWMLDV